MRLVVHDHSGYSYPIDLSRELARRGHDVHHLYCATFASPKGDLSRRADDPAGLHFRAIRHRRPFQKYAYGKRAFQEIEYGVAAARWMRQAQPDAVITTNMPLLTQWILARSLAFSRTRHVIWVQDLYSEAIASVAAHSIWPVRKAVPALARWIEASSLRRSDHVLPISDRFIGRLVHWGIPIDSMTVAPVWAPLDEITPKARTNSWSEANGLADRFVVGYTGILGLKHDATVLFELARRLPPESSITFLVAAEGPGAEWLHGQLSQLGPNRLRCMRYVQGEAYESLLASTDVLIALLNADAGQYSVPSKVASYLCAGRPVVALMPLDNDAAVALTESGAGRVVPPGDVTGAMRLIEDLRTDPEARLAMGRAGRALAEDRFDIERIADRFEEQLTESRH